MALVPKLVRLRKDPPADFEYIQGKAMMHSAGITRGPRTETSALCRRYSCSRSVVGKLTQALAQALQDRLAMACLLGVASRLMSHEARFWLFIYLLFYLSLRLSRI
jgi:hypothetical protein